MAKCFLVATLGVPAIVAGCYDSANFDYEYDPNVEGGVQSGGDTDATTGEGGIGDGGTGGDSTTTTGNDSSTRPDSSALDANQPETDARVDGAVVVDCSTRKVEADAAFVTVNGNDANACTASAPCKTISNAMTKATSRGKPIVYLAEGTYEEAVYLNPGITLEGGWKSGSTWTPICTATASDSATIQAPDYNNVTITADFGSGGSATLSTLRIKSKTQPASPGESIFGVIARNTLTKLTLKRVTIDVAAGGAGDKGGDGYSPGQAGTNCSPGTGGSADAGAGESGTGGAVGTFSSYGYQALSGDQGDYGQQGQNGAGGGAGSCVSCLYCNEQPPMPNMDGGMDDGGCISANGGQSCGQAGSAACGGGGGGGGNGGGGGGASIALLVWDAKVTTDSGSFTSKAGGNGGAGGAAGMAGQPATAGQVGQNGYDCAQDCANTMYCGPIGNAASYAHGTGGTAGTTAGGQGTSGGQGGGGTGGPSYAIYKGGTGQVTITNATALASGTGGTGGMPGGANGTSGNQN